MLLPCIMLLSMPGPVKGPISMGHAVKNVLPIGLEPLLSVTTYKPNLDALQLWPDASGHHIHADKMHPLLEMLGTY
jgi:hypothetical protein